MKFIVTTASLFYKEEEIEDLKALDFEFVQLKHAHSAFSFERVTKSVEIQLDTLEELMNFVGKFKEIIITSLPNKITIYDGRVEL